MKNRGYLIGFLILSMVYLILILSSNQSALPFIKPLLIPALMIWVIMEKVSSRALLSALFFSLLGDVLLIFDHSSYFIAGLSSFLVTQLIYTYIFSRDLKLSFKTIGVFLPFLASYLTFFLFFIWNGLGELKIPVIIYATVITTMLLMALARFRSHKNPGNAQIAFGALLFVISDSLLAYKMFQSGLVTDSFWIMLTYLAAQFFIANGIRVSEELKTFYPTHN